MCSDRCNDIRMLTTITNLYMLHMPGNCILMHPGNNGSPVEPAFISFAEMAQLLGYEANVRNGILSGRTGIGIGIGVGRDGTDCISPVIQGDE